MDEHGERCTEVGLSLIHISAPPGGEMENDRQPGDPATPRGGTGTPMSPRGYRVSPLSWGGDRDPNVPWEVTGTPMSPRDNRGAPQPGGNSGARVVGQCPF